MFLDSAHFYAKKKIKKNGDTFGFFFLIIVMILLYQIKFITEHNHIRHVAQLFYLFFFYDGDHFETINFFYKYFKSFWQMFG